MPFSTTGKHQGDLKFTNICYRRKCYKICLSDDKNVFTTRSNIQKEKKEPEFFIACDGFFLLLNIYLLTNYFLYFKNEILII